MRRLPLETARTRLTVIWCTGAGIVFVILVLESILGPKFRKDLQQLWAWFVPTVVPSLALMLGVLGADALTNDPVQRSVKAPFYKIAAGLSLFYLGILILTVALEPFSPLPGMQLFTVSNFWLSPIQGLVVAAIGVLFTSQERGGSGANTDGTKTH
jgi:hypothetical protein